MYRLIMRCVSPLVAVVFRSLFDVYVDDDVDVEDDVDVVLRLRDHKNAPVAFFSPISLTYQIGCVYVCMCVCSLALDALATVCPERLLFGGLFLQHHGASSDKTPHEDFYSLLYIPVQLPPPPLTATTKL